MRKTKKRDSLQDIVEVFKADYNLPFKSFIWAKTIKEWSGPIIWIGIFILVALIIMFSRMNLNTNSSNGFSKDDQNVISNLRSIIKFMDIAKKSVNERQELYTSLMKTINLYEGDRPEQRNIEQKIRNLSSIYNNCNTTRSIYMIDFSGFINPLTHPEIAASYAKIAASQNVLPERKGSSITAQSEKEASDLLCKLCANEVQKAQNDLVRLLNAQARAQ